MAGPEVKDTVSKVKVRPDQDWAWSWLLERTDADVSSRDIPVVQLSLTIQAASEHYALAKELAPLRQQGVLILGSGIWCII